jgi:hydrogenase maturation protein HypF
VVRILAGPSAPPPRGLTVPATAAVRLHVTGVVQGVGFRPFVHRLALRLGLAGWVRNQAGDVEIALEGDTAAIRTFAQALRVEAPPLARIERLEEIPERTAGLAGFHIAPSRDDPARRQPVSPDVATCAACEAELHDPADRRYRYPFITCTDCGPRFTVIGAMPYDRERTSMAAFIQCPACLAEYETAGDRRHHSETNSCPTCGPRLWLEDSAGAPIGDDALTKAAALLRSGGIVAVKGLGGFHLAADATDDAAVRRLRERKHREAKPLAVMVRTLAEVAAVADVPGAAAALLESRERPIVLLRRRAGGALAPAVSPGLDTVGVMLAYTPLHHLLLRVVGRPLVMTSGNRSDEPIAISNPDARARLRGIADALLLHDREIVSRYDDSVLRLAGETVVFLRRARGYAPLPVDLPMDSPQPLIAVGPHLKNTFALVHGRRAYVSQHIGDLENLETLEHFQATLDAYRRLFRITPEVAVRDLHPWYLSTEVAETLGLPRVVAVQHHHAHIAAVLAEHGETERAVGLAFDGTGYGDDGHVWGAEALIADLTTYRRVGQLRYAALPGGDAAARAPWRVALGYLALDPAVELAFAAAFHGVDERERALAAQQIRQGLNAPLASSMGRLFDAAAAVLGVRRTARYEAQAAMELEALAGDEAAEPLPFPITGEPGRWVLEPVPLLAALGEGRRLGVSPSALAAAFHESVAAAAAELAWRAAEWAGLDRVVLGGGVFQNARVLIALTRRLETRGLRVLLPRRLSPNDGAVSYGQAAVAAARLGAGLD